MIILPESQRNLSPAILKRLAITQAVVLFPLVFAIPPIFALLLILAPGWMIWRTQSQNSLQLPRWLLAVITMAAALGVFAYFKTFRGQDAGVTLIAVMYSLKILEAKTYRDANLLLTIAFFVLAMSFLFSQAIGWVLYLFVGYLFILQSLAMANSISVQPMPWLHSLKLLMTTLPVMVLLFMFFPRLPGPLWKTPSTNTATSGVSDSMTPGDIGELNLSDSPAFRVKFSEAGLIEKSSLYWRGVVFEEYDGLTWREMKNRGYFAQNISLGKDNVESKYTVTLEPTEQRFLFSLDFPISVSNNLPRRSDGTIRAINKVNQRARYQVTSRLDASIDLVLSDAAREKNLELPNGFNERSIEWSRQEYQNYSSATEYVQYLLQYINREPFYYTLSPPVMLEDMVDDFWFTQRSGFCEHYAGSLVVLLRAAGIPARVVTGYQGGEFNPVGNYWLVMQRDAHAWTEYWTPEAGWVRVDPTAAIDPSRVDDLLLQEMGERGFLFDPFDGVALLSEGWFDYAQAWLDSMNNGWQQWVLDYNQASQFDLLESLKLDKVESRYLYIGFILLLSAIFAIIAWRIIGDRPKHDQVAKMMLRLLAKLKKQGFQPDRSEPTHIFLQRVVQQRPEWQEQLEPLITLYIAIRFANQTSRHQEQELANYVRQLSI